MLPFISLNVNPTAAIVNQETMGFHDNAIFPTSISYGSTGGPRWETDIRRTDAGIETRLARWGEASLMRFQLNFNTKSDADVMTATTFARGRRGAAYGFLFEDWRDHTNHQDGVSDGTALADRINLGAGDGSETQFQLYKYYEDDFGYTTARKITRPKANTVSVWVNGVLQTEVVDYGLDIDTGVISFVSAPTAGHAIDVAFEFYVPCRFGEDVDDWMEVVQSAHQASQMTLTVEEIRDIGEMSEAYAYGSGARYTDNVTTRVLRFSDGLYQMYDGNSTGLDTTVLIWNPVNAANGGPYHIIHNSEPNGRDLTIQVQATGATITVPSGKAVRLFVVSGTFIAVGG